jgi:hypothetical protein
MRSLVVAALAAAVATSAFAGSAQAARRICRGQARGPAGDVVHVDLEFRDGKAIGRHVSWTPQSTGETPAPVLIVGSDINGDRPGPPLSVSILAILDAERTPKSSHADIIVRAPDGAVWRKPWRMYEEEIKRRRAGTAAPGAPAGAKVTGFYGIVPLASREENAPLVASIDKLQSLSVSVVGDQGDRFGERIYVFGDKTARTDLFARAYAQAAEAAKSPDTCEAASD